VLGDHDRDDELLLLLEYPTAVTEGLSLLLLPKASTTKLHVLGSISYKFAIKIVISFNATTAFICAGLSELFAIIFLSMV
jgi:hypothetical protein